MDIARESCMEVIVNFGMRRCGLFSWFSTTKNSPVYLLVVFEPEMKVFKFYGFMFLFRGFVWVEGECSYS